MCTGPSQRCMSSEHFGQLAYLIAYVNLYRAAQVPADFKVRFLEYHWTVNHRKWAYVR